MSEFLQSAASWKMRTCVLIFVSIIVEYLLSYNQISFIAQQAMASDYETECKNVNLFRAATEDEKRKVVESVVFFYGSAVSRNVVQGEKLLPRFALPFLKIP